VVDDGPSVATADLVRAYDGVELARHDRNSGYGAALKAAFAHARGQWIAFLDADGTYPPEYLPQLCECALEQKADLVVDSRRSGARSQMPFTRRVGNLLWSSLLTALGNRKASDPASGMRLIRREALPLLLPLPDGLHFAPVMSTRAVHEQLHMVDVPIHYSERDGRSKLHVLRDGTRFHTFIIWTALCHKPVRLLGLAGL